MFNRKIEATKENQDILFVNAVIENLRYGLISLDAILNGKTTSEYYNDEHTFYFFHVQSLLTAKGNIYNVLFNDYPRNAAICRQRIQKVRDAFGLDLKQYELIKNNDLRNTNAHFDERYYTLNSVGDLNILKTDTPEVLRNKILSEGSLRTLDLVNCLYISCDKQGGQIVLNLQDLRVQMYNMLMELCIRDIRRR